MADVRESVLKALDDAFCDGIKGLYGAAVSNAAGGESIDVVMERFYKGFDLECRIHARILSEIEPTMKEVENG
jgi:hypothetical protein